MQVRFELTQAADAQKFSTTATDTIQQACMARCKLLEAALVAPHGRKLSIGETASLMWLMLHGHLDSISCDKLWVRTQFCSLKPAPSHHDSRCAFYCGNDILHCNLLFFGL
jgi:hypothetical protein